MPDYYDLVFEKEQISIVKKHLQRVNDKVCIDIFESPARQEECPNCHQLYKWYDGQTLRI